MPSYLIVKILECLTIKHRFTKMVKHFYTLRVTKKTIITIDETASNSKDKEKLI